MENQVFRLGEGLKLIPISFAGAEIGNRVRYARDYGIYTIIGKEISGWIIGNGKGETHSGQQIESLSPFTRIEVLTGLPNATPEEIEALKEAVEDKRQADKLQMEAAAVQKNAEYEKCLAELKKRYPNAEQKGSSYARAAKNLKAELKKAFPLVKFSVNSDSFSMGNSIRVYWENGCTEAQVKEIADKYEYGRYDGSEDIYNYSDSAYTKAVGEWLGSTKYLSTERQISDAVKEQVKEAIKAGYGDYINELPPYEFDRKTYQALQDVEVYGVFTGVEIEAGQYVARFENTRTIVEKSSPTEPTEIDFTTAEFVHTAKNTECFVATLTDRVETDEFKAMMSKARSFGGYYSRFNKNGAIAGFIFSSAEKRQEFINSYK